MPMRMAKIAVSAATYSIDRPFDYLVPEALWDAALPGTRVSLPFGKGNRRCEGVILSVADKSERCLLYTSPSPRDAHESRMPSSA